MISMNLFAEHVKSELTSLDQLSVQKLYAAQFDKCPNAFIEFALDSVLALVDAHAGSLYLWDQEKKALVLKTARGPYQSRVQTETPVRLRHGVSGWVGDTGRSVLVKDIEDDDRFDLSERKGKYKSLSFISLPLISSNKLLGVINVTERENLAPFNETDLERTRLFVQHIALAYDSMRLAQKYRSENESLHDQVNHLESKLKDNEHFIAIGKLASNLAHELNNPMDSIRRYVNLALDQVKQDSLAKEYLLKSKEGIRRAIHVIRGLLQFSRESRRMDARESRIHEVIVRSIEGVTSELDYTKVMIEFEKIDPAVYVADTGFFVVFRNLLKNAYHAMQGAGCIRISHQIDEKFITICVKDTGPGMSPEVRSRIFEPFFSTKKGDGTGIGLTICREIVQKAGGEIDCTHTGSNGTEFRMILPYRRK